MHFFYNSDIIYDNFKKLLRENGKIIITDIWSKESINIFLNKLKKHKLKIELQEDLSKGTIDSMHHDIFNTFVSHWEFVKDNSIYAFLRIQRERLQLFVEDFNKQFKYIITK